MSTQTTKPQPTTATKPPAVAPSRNGREPDVEQPQPLPVLPFITEEELLTREFPEPGWFIPGLLPIGLVSSIIGPSGAGKTWLALYLMLKLSEGGQVFGNPARRSRVAIVDAEDEPADMQARWRKLTAGMGRSSSHETVMFLSGMGAVSILSPQLSRDGTPSLSEWGERLQESIRVLNLELVFVDSLAKVHALPESDESMKHVFSVLQLIARNTGCTFVVLHHAGWAPTGSKRPERGRGSSTIRDNVVSELFIVETDDGAISLKLNKLKRGPKTALKLPQVRIVEGDDGAVRLEFDEAGTPTNFGEVRRSAILKTLEEAEGPLTFTVLRDLVCAETGHGQTIVEGDIRTLKAEGRIVQNEARGPYRLP